MSTKIFFSESPVGKTQHLPSAGIANLASIFCVVWSGFPEVPWRPDPLHASTSASVVPYIFQRNLP